MSYPKYLYRGGWEPLDALLVHSEVDEAEARSNGYGDAPHDVQEQGQATAEEVKQAEPPAKRGPGRPRKVQP